MKSFKLIAALCAACFLSAAVFAADAVSPAGTWKWTPPGRGGNPGVERALKLDYTGGKLTGTMLAVDFGRFKLPDTAIADGAFADGAFADGVVSFTVTTEFNGNKRTTKYSGKLDGDSIKGSFEAPGRDGEVRKVEWNPTRAK